MVEVESSERRVPYVSFTAFKKLLDRMTGEVGPPNRVDRTYLVGMSGGYQAQLLAALRALGLIDEAGRSTPTLRSLTHALDQELPGFMQQQVQLLYPEAVELAAANGSAGELHDLFRQHYGVSGSTLESAVRFYLDASAFAGMQVSPHFRAPTRAKARKTPKMTPMKTATTRASEPTTSDQPTMGVMPSSTQRVNLASGGNLVLTMTADLFSLTDSDRDFVFGIVDQVRSYRQRHEGDPSTDASSPFGASSSQSDSDE